VCIFCPQYFAFLNSFRTTHFNSSAYADDEVEGTTPLDATRIHPDDYELATTIIEHAFKDEAQRQRVRDAKQALKKAQKKAEKRAAKIAKKKKKKKKRGGESDDDDDDDDIDGGGDEAVLAAEAALVAAETSNGGSGDVPVLDKATVSGEISTLIYACTLTCMRTRTRTHSHPFLVTLVAND
jgi:hypothetical protein